MPQQAVQLKQTGAQRYTLYYNSTSLDEIGAGISGRAVTDTLYVSPNGNGLDGSTWDRAYTTIQAALDAASTDADDNTQIVISPHTTYYDIDTTGNPTWTGNYEIIGSHRLWAAVRNSHASATCIMKFTGKVSIRDLAIFQIGTVNGVIFTGNGFRIRDCGFNSEGLTGAATAIYIDGSGGMTQGGIIDDIQLLGHVSYTKGLYINASRINEFSGMHIHKCLTGIQIAGATSDSNTFMDNDIGDCALGIDIDAGNEQLFDGLVLHHNTANVDDEVGDSIWNNIQGEFDVSIEPNNFTGVTVATHADADTFTTTPVEVRAAATSTKPFKIAAYVVEGSAAEKFRVRFSSNSGASYFADMMIEGEVNKIKSTAKQASDATDHIFNKGTQIVASAKSESGGNSVVVWLKIQEI